MELYSRSLLPFASDWGVGTILLVAFLLWNGLVWIVYLCAVMSGRGHVWKRAVGYVVLAAPFALTIVTCPITVILVALAFKTALSGPTNLSPV